MFKVLSNNKYLGLKVKLVIITITLLLVYEGLRIYWIMPLPGSQRNETVLWAYSLHHWRWYVRILAGIIMALCFTSIKYARYKWGIWVYTGMAWILIYLFNYPMSADQMFRQPETLQFGRRSQLMIDSNALVISVQIGEHAKAYPVRYLTYHHQVRDTIGKQNIMVTYCNVCRTGRVYVPEIQNQNERFRLVGMDHYNAMFEDSRTKSWWRQSTGECIAGPLKGNQLQEWPSEQISLQVFFEKYPLGLVMLPDSHFTEQYDLDGKFEKGKSLSDLTRTDTTSWKDKSWVIGVIRKGGSKAYDWNRLKREKLIVDHIGGERILVVLEPDQENFHVYLAEENIMYSLSSNSETGDTCQGVNPCKGLQLIPAYQEFWHSWRTFHPATAKY